MRTTFFLTLSFIATNVFAQAPERMSYQAVIRDGTNALVTNTAVGMRLSILQGSTSGPSVYVETQTPTSNTNGLVSVEIGDGAVVSGSMAAIDWSAGPYFIQTETDPLGGSAYSITGAQQLLSVPYALYAANGGTVGPQGPPGPAGPVGPGACEMIRTGDGRAVVYTATNAYGFGFNEVSGSGWYSITLNGSVIGALASDTSVVLYTATNAYGFGPNGVSGSGWYTTALNGTPIGALASSGRIAVYTDTKAYGFGYDSVSGSGWASITMASTPTEQLAAGNRIILYSGTNAYGFGFNSVGGSSWYSFTLGAPPLDHIGTR